MCSFTLTACVLTSIHLVSLAVKNRETSNANTCNKIAAPAYLCVMLRDTIFYVLALLVISFFQKNVQKSCSLRRETLLLLYDQIISV